MSIETVKAAYDVQLASPTPILKADMIPIHKDAVDLLADYATDSEVVKLTGDQTITGEKTIEGDNDCVILKPATLNKAYFIKGRTNDNAEHWYLGQGADSDTSLTLHNYLGGTYLELIGDTVNTNKNFASLLQPTNVAHLTRKDYVDARIVKLTQAEYDALTPDETVLYVIVG